MGPAFNHIKEAMLGHISAVELAQIAKSGTARSVPFDKLLEKLPAVMEEFGDTSPEYNLSTLQLRLKGLRGELGSVVVVPRDNPSLEEAPNFYFCAGGRLVIRDFKTKQAHPKCALPFKEISETWSKSRCSRGRDLSSSAIT